MVEKLNESDRQRWLDDGGPARDDDEPTKGADMNTVRMMDPATLPAPHDAPDGYTAEGFDELAADVKAQGKVNVPLIISARGNVIEGHRRRRAAILAGLKTVPVVMDDSVTTEAQEVAYTLRSEKHRNARNPATHAVTIEGFKQRNGLKTGKEVALALGDSEATISRYSRILKNPQDVIDAVGQLKLSMAHLQAVSKLDDEVRRLELLRMAIADQTITAAALGKLAFPPKKARASKFWEVQAEGLTLKVGAQMDLEGFQRAWAAIKAQVEDKYRETNKKQLPVVQVMLGVTLNT